MSGERISGQASAEEGGDAEGEEGAEGGVEEELLQASLRRTYPSCNRRVTAV